MTYSHYVSVIYSKLLRSVPGAMIFIGCEAGRLSWPRLCCYSFREEERWPTQTIKAYESGAWDSRFARLVDPHPNSTELKFCHGPVWQTHVLYRVYPILFSLSCPLSPTPRRYGEDGNSK
ncbi:unnamed protein product [Laminaria digitata]